MDGVMMVRGVVLLTSHCLCPRFMTMRRHSSGAARAEAKVICCTHGVGAMSDSDTASVSSTVSVASSGAGSAGAGQDAALAEEKKTQGNEAFTGACLASMYLAHRLL